MKNEDNNEDTEESWEFPFTSFQFVTALGLNLDLAGIFFVNAHLQIEEGNKRYIKLNAELEKYKRSYTKRAAKLPIESEDFVTYQVHRLREVEMHYEPVVRHFATAKILLACCAETYINEVASVAIQGRAIEEFDKLSIVGKWIFIQDILKLKKQLTIDKNPLQDFAQLIRERNKLVHFKGLNKKIPRLEIPDFLGDLKLSTADCSKNFQAVKKMIRSFSLEWKGSFGPDWLNIGGSGFRNPCFYSGNREASMVFHSDKVDKSR